MYWARNISDPQFEKISFDPPALIQGSQNFLGIVTFDRPDGAISERWRQALLRHQNPWDSDPGPRSMVTRLQDVNADGRPDLITAQTDGKSIAISLGMGQGSNFRFGPVRTLFLPAVLLADWQYHLNHSPLGLAFENGGGVCGDVFDITGDGLPDYIIANWNTSDWHVFPGYLLGDEIHFSATLFTFHAGHDAIPSKPQWPIHSKWTDMIDMNGDGLADQVNVRVSLSGPPTWTVRYNTGAGFSDVTLGPWAHDDQAIGGLSTPASRFRDPEEARTASLLIDMNGDGLPDYITSSEFGKTFTVSYNTGSSFRLGGKASLEMPNWRGQPVHLYASSTTPGAGILKDINGDGTLDYVLLDAWVVFPGRQTNDDFRSDVMTAITTPSGLRTRVYYTSSSVADIEHVPFIYPIVDMTETEGPFAQEGILIQYSYSNYLNRPSLFDPAKTDHLGYEATVADNKSTRLLTTTLVSTAQSFAGMPIEVTVVSSASQQLISRQRLTLLGKRLRDGTCTVNPLAADLPVRSLVMSLETTQFEKNDAFTSTTTLTCPDMDRIGNVLSKTVDPDVTVAGDETVTKVAFDIGDGTSCKACPVEQQILNSKGKPLTHTYYRYSESQAVLPRSKAGTGHLSYREQVTAEANPSVSVIASKTYFNGNGTVRTIQQTDPPGETTMDYDSRQLRVTRITQSYKSADGTNAALVTDTTYDEDFGLPALVKGPYRLQEPSLAALQAYLYDSLGRLKVTAKGPIVGNIINQPLMAYEYLDATKQPQAIRTYHFQVNRPLDITAPLPQTNDVLIQTTYFDNFGRALQTRRRLGGSGLSAPQTHIGPPLTGYEVTGAVLYDGAGRPYTTVEDFYSANGEFQDYFDISVRATEFKDAVKGTNRVYDDRGRMICSLYRAQKNGFDPRHFDQYQDCLSYLGEDENYRLATRFAYDVASYNNQHAAITRTVFPEQNVTSSARASQVEYHRSGMSIREDAYGNVAEVIRDPLGRVIRQTRKAVGASKPVAVEILTQYDLVGRIISTFDSSAGKRVFHYFDSGPVKRVGQLVTPQAPNGAEGIEYVYDGLGRITEVRFSGRLHPSRQIFYDCPYEPELNTVVCDPRKRKASNPYTFTAGKTSAVLTDSTTIAYGYRQDGQVIQRDQWFKSAGPTPYRMTQTVGHTGNLLSRTVSMPAAADITYETYYDSYGRIVKVERPLTGLGELTGESGVFWEATHQALTGAYDPQGRPFHINEDNGNVVINRTFSKFTGQLNGYIVQKISDSPSSVQMIYGASNIQYYGFQLAGYDELATGLTHRFLYDRDQRLATATRTKDGKPFTQEQFSYFLTKDFDVTRPTAPSLWNVEQVTRSLADASKVNELYQYGNGQNNSQDTVGSIHSEASTVEVQYGVKPELGLVAGLGPVPTWKYDIAGRLTDILLSTETEHLLYDGTGALSERRITKGGHTSIMYYVGPYATVKREDMGSSKTGVHILLGNRRLATLWDAESSVLYYYRDLRGSVVVTMMGGMAYNNFPGSSYQYDAYGAVEKQTLGLEFLGLDETQSEIGYIGGLTLTGGLIHLNARVYHPGLRRFLQPDSVDPLRYTYTGGDPINRTDPSGLGAAFPRWSWWHPRMGFNELYFHLHNVLSPAEWQVFGPSAMVAKTTWMNYIKIKGLGTFDKGFQTPSFAVDWDYYAWLKWDQHSLPSSEKSDSSSTEISHYGIADASSPDTSDTATDASNPLPIMQCGPGLCENWAINMTGYQDNPIHGVSWNMPYSSAVAWFYGTATDPTGLLRLTDVSEAFGNNPWANCVRGCLMDSWFDGGTKSYSPDFFTAHVSCFAVCGGPP